MAYGHGFFKDSEEAFTWMAKELREKAAKEKRVSFTSRTEFSLMKEAIFTEQAELFEKGAQKKA